VPRLLSHRAAYGSRNKYRPVNRSKASGSNAKAPNQAVYFPCDTATPLTITAAVKTMDIQRWVCRIHLFQLKGSPDSRLLSRLGLPRRCFNTELLRVLCVQPLPAFELHRLATNEAAEGIPAEKALQNIETNVPASGSP